jgi:hypothetical protein
LEHIFEISEGFDVVELRRGDEGADHGPSRSTAVGTREQVILALMQTFA